MEGDRPQPARLRIEVVGIEDPEAKTPVSIDRRGNGPILSRKARQRARRGGNDNGQDYVGHEEGHLSNFEYERLAERMYELGTERVVSLAVVGIFGAAVFFGLGAASLRWGNPGDLRAALQVVLPPTAYVVGLAVLKSRLLLRMKRRS